MKTWFLTRTQGLWTFFTTKMWSGGKTKTVQDADDDVLWERTVFVIPSEDAEPRGQTQDEFDRMHHLSANTLERKINHCNSDSSLFRHRK
jgi:hypothetical protein